ncbi:hypothetical protein G210_3431 [Candida maltosa Xu316]|uniref:U1-type domain-containing protein n=1 Tax=Candida maltosa (strain Xu316) TaxID=1245528 RepID=M3HGC2_CANMX|nr:hypothetical protein G210_3431 [Candida maltosa Xu316]
MNNFIEQQRSSIEDCDILEEAVSNRFLKNPHSLPKFLRPTKDILLSKISKPKTTRKISLLEQYELKYFLDQYNQTIKNLNHCIDHEQSLLDKDLESLTESNSFTKFDELINSIPSNNEIVKDPRFLYSSFSSLNKEKHPHDAILKSNKKTGREQEYIKRKHFLSLAASHLGNSIIDETIDLHHFHDLYVKNIENVSYIEYLYKFANFPYPKINGNYHKYLSELSQFLEKKLVELHPLIDHEQLMKSWKSEFGNTNEKESETNDKGEVYCKPCNKFISENVYKFHIDSKKHKKNASKETQSDDLIPWLEYLISKLTDELTLDLEYTKSQAEKTSHYSEREWKIDQQAQHDIENEFVSVDNKDELANDNEDDSDSDDDLDDSFKHLPVGPDGAPMPFWSRGIKEKFKEKTRRFCRS